LYECVLYAHLVIDGQDFSMRRNWLLAAAMATTFLVATLSLANTARADAEHDS